MKKLSIVMIVTVFLGLGVVMAQTSDSSRPESGCYKFKCRLQFFDGRSGVAPPSALARVAATAMAVTPPRMVLALGAKSGNRQKRNASLGQGKGMV
ncbi:hypothetical protein MASR1M12_22280 [Erysipelotrichia bacterium]